MTTTESTRLVAERIRHIWRDPLDRPAGLLQVMAVANRTDGSLAAMRIGPQTPSSATDQFSLEIARARADIILTSGAILRSEPDLIHAIGPAVEAWRREVLRKTEPPEIIFISRGHGFPFDHPALRQPGATLATGATTPDGFMAEIRKRGIRHRTLSGNSPRRLVDELLSRQARTITLECGPSTASQFYQGRLQVQELMLSWCQGFELPERLDAGEVASLAQLRQHFGSPRSDYTTDESAYPWRFSRWVATGAFTP